ncbi:GNAT family N-acetyltransferase [Ensifer aridi]|uniref:GNAT family N-acetyltransferase n=1 Tax=Ensifer aridi TaxID=1708715 RepID=UPI00358DF3E4
MELKLRRAIANDIAFIMRTERLEGYETLVGRWEKSRHMDNLNDMNYSYIIAETDGAPVGFAILCNWASCRHSLCIVRVAIAERGRGFGKALMRSVTNAAFRETKIHRLWLTCFPENLPARSCYETVGFVAEGVTRGSAFFNNEYRDELKMSLLRPEWVPDALQTATAPRVFSDAQTSL